MIEATIRPFRESSRNVQLEVQIPPSVQPGTLRLLVSDGPTVDRLRSLPGIHPLDLLDIINRANALHSDNRLYVTLLDHAAQAALEATSLTTIPLSMVNVLEPLKDTQRARLSGESLQELGSLPLNGALTGSQVLSLTIR